jgi:sarcosine oxidase / L-pipecolate oxidase
MEAAGYRDTQLITTDEWYIAIANDTGWAFGIDPFRRVARGKSALGVLDTTGGMLVADKACLFALHKARTLGVKCFFGKGRGELKRFVREGETVVGIKTANGNSYYASKIIIACGAWTPSILPQLSRYRLVEATAGSVVMLRIPRSSVELWDRFDPSRFPTYTWNIRDGANGGIYGFPRDDEGWLKIGYRGLKYTNLVDVEEDNYKEVAERSTPITAFTQSQAKPTQGIPRKAFEVISTFLAEYLPELKAQGISITSPETVMRLCWYTDSVDNHHVVDYIPGNGFENVMVATGGSGHAFKYLPVVGKYVADVMEGVGLERELLRKWRWRSPEQGGKVVNILMQGKEADTDLRNVEMVMGSRSNVRKGGSPRL